MAETIDEILNRNNQDEIELLKRDLIWNTARFEAVKMEAMEKLKKSNEMQNHLLNLLNIALQERDEARYQLQKLQNMHVLSSGTPSAVTSIHSHGSSIMTPPAAYGSNGSIPKWTNPFPLFTNLKLPPPSPPNFFKHFDGANDNHPLPDAGVASYMVPDPLPYRGMMDCRASNRQQCSGVAKAPITMVPNPLTAPENIQACATRGKPYQVSSDPRSIVVPIPVDSTRAFTAAETNQLSSLPEYSITSAPNPLESSSQINMMNPLDDSSNPNYVQKALNFCFQDMSYGASSKEDAKNGAPGSSSPLKNILSLNAYASDASKKLRRKHQKGH